MAGMLSASASPRSGPHFRVGDKYCETGPCRHNAFGAISLNSGETRLAPPTRMSRPRGGKYWTMLSFFVQRQICESRV